MDSNYHIFKKTIKTNKKTTHKWYYFWNDPVTGKKYQRVCKGCKTQAEAFEMLQEKSFRKLQVTVQSI